MNYYKSIEQRYIPAPPKQHYMVPSFVKKRPAKIVLNYYQNQGAAESNKMSSHYNSTSMMSEEAAGMIDYINTSVDAYSGF